MTRSIEKIDCNRYSFIVRILRMAMKNINLSLKRKSEGASAVEYALIIALIAAVIGVGVAAFGNSLNTFFSTLFNSLNL